MAKQGTMANDQHASSSAGRHDLENDCHDSQIVPVEPNEHIEQPASGFIFHVFPYLPWELRRLIWEFALPRNIFWSATVDAKTRVPYPTIALVCHEAFLVVKELGSMVTAWKHSSIELLHAWNAPESFDPSIYTRTWFSPKLDMIVLDPDELITLCTLGEAVRCDLLDICRVPTTSLIVHGAGYGYEHFTQMYERYIKTRDTVFLNIEEFELMPKNEASGKILAQQLLGKTRTTDLIRLDDTAAVAKYQRVWEHCCQVDTTNLLTTGYCDFGTWMNMATDEDKSAETPGYMRTYKAWMVEDEVYVEHSVTPKALFLLELADSIMSDYGLQPHLHRGHEIVEYTGKLKKGHPLVRELDIKLPDVIPVCTIHILVPCFCDDCHAQDMSE